MMNVTAAGRTISRERIFREAQYHPAVSWGAACHEATRALVIRELLLSEAEHLGRGRLSDGASERDVQDALRAVVDASVSVPEVSDRDCAEFYRQNQSRFVGPVLFEASHILFACSAERDERRAAKARALEVLSQLEQRPDRFERLAREVSGCPSASSGGRLGQLSPGETVAPFEQVLHGLSPGDIHPAPVETKHGFHIVRLDQRSLGRPLPYASVEARIRIYLRERAFRGRLQQYISELAERRGVSGFDLNSPAPTTPAADAAELTSGPLAPGGEHQAGRRRLPLIRA